MLDVSSEVKVEEKKFANTFAFSKSSLVVPSGVIRFGIPKESFFLDMALKNNFLFVEFAALLRYEL